jgi:hypothetical protein
MGALLRMLERDLKVAQKTDCISRAFAHIHGEGYRRPSHRRHSLKSYDAQKLTTHRILDSGPDHAVASWTIPFVCVEWRGG